MAKERKPWDTLYRPSRRMLLPSQYVLDADLFKDKTRYGTPDKLKFLSLSTNWNWRWDERGAMHLTMHCLQASML
jgi:hypothetical protein